MATMSFGRGAFPGPEQLLVKVDSATLNPLDWKIRSFGLYVKECPAILGIEVGVNVYGFEKVIECQHLDTIYTPDYELLYLF